MVCIYCGYKTQVFNSRAQRRTNQIWRRRRCLACKSIFTSIETADYGHSWLVRAISGSVEPFSRDKLFLSMLEACKHRPTAVADAGSLCATVIGKLAPTVSNGQVAALMIARTALVALNRFDQAAASHYQAFHKS